MPVSVRVYDGIRRSTGVYVCISRSTGVYVCISRSTGVYVCISRSTGVYVCISRNLPHVHGINCRVGVYWYKLPLCKTLALKWGG